MGATATFDRDDVIRRLEARGLPHDSAEGIADVLRDYVLPYTASKRGEASARGRMTARINVAFEQISDLVTRVGRIEETMATKQDLADLRHSLVLTFGGMLAGAVAFLTVVQGFLN